MPGAHSAPPVISTGGHGDAITSRAGERGGALAGEEPHDRGDRDERDVDEEIGPARPELARHEGGEHAEHDRHGRTDGQAQRGPDEAERFGLISSGRPAGRRGATSPPPLDSGRFSGVGAGAGQNFFSASLTFLPAFFMSPFACSRRPSRTSLGSLVTVPAVSLSAPVARSVLSPMVSLLTSFALAPWRTPPLGRETRIEAPMR